MNNRLNKYKYPGAKRLMLEAQELKDNTEDYCAQPIDDNLFEWHFTVRGPPDTAFDGGYYHGRLSFPTEYPMKPPSIILLTPNGRFETNKKICLSISGYHPETWQPSWSVRTALLALIAFMPTKANRAIGSLDFSDAERKKLAIKSRTWSCETCGPIKNLLRHPEDSSCESTNSKLEPCTSTSRDNNSTNIDNNEEAHSNSNFNNDIRDKSILSSVENKLSNTKESNSEHQIATNFTRTQTWNSQQQERVQYEQTLQRENSNERLDNLNDRRRSSYPPLVFKSICVLLSLLLLRRVVIILQA